MKPILGKVKLNKIILYLLIAIFLVLALQYAMAYFNLKTCNIETFKKLKKVNKKVNKIKKVSKPSTNVSKINLPKQPTNVSKINLPKQPANVPNTELDTVKKQSTEKDKTISELREENLRQKDEISNKNQEIDAKDKEIDNLNYEVSQVQGIGAATQESFAPYY